jgi:peptidyl-prolyl cis-trans isomerase D
MIRFLQTPGPIKKIVLGGLLLVICAAMVITLVPGGIGDSFFGLGGPGKGILAKVAGQDITTLEVERQARQMLQQQFPRGSAQASMLLPYFASQAAQRLINDKAILAEARRLGFSVSDEELRDQIQHSPLYGPAFFPGGNFVGQEAYQARLQQADLTVPQFEENVKEEILFDKLRDLVAGGATVSEAEVRQEFEKQNTKVKFEYAVLQKDEVLKSIHATDAELKAYYQHNLQKYANSIPEKRKVKYVVINTAALQAQMQVTPQDLRDYYDEHRDEYRVPDQIDVRQILIKTPLPDANGKVDPKGMEAARKKAEDVLRQLKAGANFADMAKKYSEDPSSKDGGSLGWMEPSRFPSPEVQKAALSLGKGGTSDVINAGYAFVILHVDDTRQAHVKTLDEVKDQITPVIRQQKALRAADAEATALLAQARGNGLDKAAAAKGLQVITTNFVSRTDSLPGIGNSTQFMDALFTEPEKSPPDEVQLAQGTAIFELMAIRPPATPTFDEIRNRVEADFKNERADALLSQKTQQLSDRAKAEHDLKRAAREAGATMKTSDFVLPDAQVPEIGSMSSGAASAAFTMKPGDISGPIVTSSDGAVLSVLEKQAPSDQDFAAKKDQIRDSLLQSKQQELFGLFVANLRDRMEKSGKIKINQDEMKSLTRTQGGEEGE